MYEYERSYKTGRGVCVVMELLGWLLVFVGFIAVIVGYSSGGLVGFASRSFMEEGPPVVFRLIATIPGLLTMAAGVYSVMETQKVKATLDSAEMTREMLSISRRNDGALSSNRVEPSISRGLAPASSTLVKYYRTKQIMRRPTGGVTVDGEVFNDVQEAEKHIDMMLKNGA
ncbi:hypothetical protein M2324_004005 [Rhodovulum sulfidophilum]|uniref:hypothetical protein n=1 Tax=Rhodovulum sulfidophilum TaxID=35806 RepID=UPI0012DA408C|nr:hypothetical protein [Rhodovulum sulfidophilum]MCW2305578.1 hypothetical protein [Rhodovulum sulfidophilum]